MAGTASGQQFNKTLRQTSIIARMIAQFIVDRLNVDAIDDGTIATLETNFIAAVRSTFSIPPTGVTPGTYGPTMSLAVQADGRITGLSNTGLIVTGVGAGSYGPTVTIGVQSDGRITSLSNTALPFFHIQVFLDSGTFVVPADITRVKVTVVGGGSGAMGCNANAPVSVFAGPCGAGGGWAIKYISGLTPGTSIAVVVGAGGTGTAAGTPSNPGGTSSFGAFCSATGGGPAGGPVGSGALYAGAGGGVGLNGDLNSFGGMGSDGSPPGPLGLWPGLSGGSLFGGSVRSGTTSGNPGIAGASYGAGGGSPYALDGTIATGGSGFKGVVIVEW